MTCDEIVPLGKVLSIYAYEGFDGAVHPTGAGNPFNFQGIMHEFVGFQGNDCLQPTGFLPGDCAITVSAARTYTVTVDFTVHPRFRIYSTGMTSAQGIVDARDILGLPVRANIFTAAGTGGSSSSEVLVTEGAFPFGTEITLVAQPVNQAQFVRWEGCKTGTGGTNPTCTLPSSTSGATPATVRLFGEYWQCANNTIADAPGAGCTKITP
jgi:hypothetical protein